jgi:hypothetical protein
MRRLSNILVVTVFWSSVYGVSYLALSYLSTFQQQLLNAPTPRELASQEIKWGRAFPFVNLPDGSMLTIDTVIDPIFGIVFALYLVSLAYTRGWFKARLGSTSAQGDRNVAFFIVFQCVRVVASFSI